LADPLVWLSILASTRGYIKLSLLNLKVPQHRVRLKLILDVVQREINTAIASSGNQLSYVKTQLIPQEQGLSDLELAARYYMIFRPDLVEYALSRE
jgi:hypothetical protein